MEGAVSDHDAELRALERAVATTKRRSYLDAIDGQRRRLRLKFISNDLLRKPATAVQKRRMRALAGCLADQARQQMRDRNRRPFRGDVAVEIDLHAIGVQQPAASPPAVKAYLDLLQGIAYPDDRRIAYLRVTRHAKDNPLFRDVPSDWIYGGTTPRFPRGPESHVEVRITIQPLRTYTADVDRLFLLSEQVFGDEYEERDADGVEFFAARFDHMRDDFRLDELREEARDEAEGRGLWAPDGPLAERPNLLADLRRMHRAEHRALRRKLLLGGGPAPLDRPGPPPVIHRWMWHQHQDWKKHDLDDLFGPGRFLLPEPPTAPGDSPWREEVRHEMAAHHGRWRVLDAMIDTPLALDLAVRPAAGRDLDNLARHVVVPFEEVFCGNDRGSVASYRVYQAPPESGPSGVRLSVIGDERLDAFERAIETACHWLLCRGPRYDDD
jgi:hypothetical protein